MCGNEFGSMFAQPLALDIDTFICVAAACIHSRKVGDSWQYSSEEMSTLTDYIVEWYSSRAYNQMMASYGAEGFNATNGRRVLQQATNQPYNGKIAVLSATVSDETLGVTKTVRYLASVRENVDASKVADNVVALFTEDGKASGNLIGVDGSPLILKGKGDEYLDITPASVNWTGGTIEWFPDYLPQVVG